jgi:hypothetical protein
MWLGNAVAGFDEDASMLKTGTPKLPRFFLSWRAETGSVSFAKGKQNENELVEISGDFEHFWFCENVVLCGLAVLITG